MAEGKRGVLLVAFFFCTQAAVGLPPSPQERSLPQAMDAMPPRCQRVDSGNLHPERVCETFCVARGCEGAALALRCKGAAKGRLGGTEQRLEIGGVTKKIGGGGLPWNHIREGSVRHAL